MLKISRHSLLQGGAFAAFSFYSLMVIWFVGASGDEGGYHYQALAMSRGLMPVLEYYQQHLSWAYLPYSWIIRWLSPSIEAVRLYSLFSSLAVVAIIWRIVGRSYGINAGWMAFLLLGLNSFWLEIHREVNWAASTNLGLVVAYAILCMPSERVRFMQAFALGVAVGLFINSRVVLLPLGFVILILLWLRIKQTANQASLWSVIGAFCMGALLMSLPTLFYFFSDPGAFLFNSLLARVAITQFDLPYEGPLGWVAWFVSTRALAIPDFFGLLPGNPRIVEVLGRFMSNLVFLVFPGVLLMTLLSRHSLREAGCVIGQWYKTDRVLSLSFIFTIGIFGCYSMADRIAAEYLHHWVPFLCIQSIGLFVVAKKVIPDENGQKALNLSFFVPVILSALFYLMVSVAAILYRDSPAISRPLTEARIACWLEQNTPPESVVMSYYGGVVAAADRWLPRGFEQGVGIIGLFWATNASTSLTDRYHVLGYSKFLEKLRDGGIPVVVADSLTEPFTNEINEYMKAYYRLHADTRVGGANPIYEIWIHRSADSHEFAKLAASPSLPMNGIFQRYKESLRKEGLLSLVKAVASDVRFSISELPKDFSVAVARVMRRPYSSRCPQQHALRVVR